MRELTDPRMMYLKAWLFAVSGASACAAILLERPSLRVGLLLLIAVWSFCRLYYFLFHVLERYAGGERYAGLWDALRQVLAARGGVRAGRRRGR